MSRNDWETDGTRDGRPIYCPENNCDCPYFGKGICHITNPVRNCDDFAYWFPTWQEWDDA